MKIPDYCAEDFEDESKYLINFPFSMIIVGITLCGKTNLLIHMLLNDFFEFYKIYYYGLNPHQKYTMFKKYFR